MDPTSPDMALELASDAHAHAPDEDLFYFSVEDLLKEDFNGKLKPILEIVFVRLFDEEHGYRLLIAFLNDFLELEGLARILRVERMQTRLLSDHAGEKDPIIDLLVCDQQERQLQIELQLAGQPSYMSRAIYYAAKVHGAQLERGDDYGKLGQTICIHILAWNLFLPTSGWPECVTVGKLCDVKHGRVLSDQIQLWFVELVKFRTQLDELRQRREKWLYYLKHADRLTTEQVRRMGMNELQEADLKLRAISRERQLRLAYIQRMKAEHDQINFREGYLREGYDKGMKDGVKEGIKEGTREGRQTLLHELYADGLLSKEEYERRLADLILSTGG